jgi:hypothetical protein
VLGEALRLLGSLIAEAPSAVVEGASLGGGALTPTAFSMGGSMGSAIFRNLPATPPHQTQQQTAQQPFLHQLRSVVDELEERMLALLAAVHANPGAKPKVTESNQK